MLPEVKDRSFTPLEAFDGYAPLRNALRKLSRDEESWAGIPMPIEGHRMVIEPHFPRAKALADIGISQAMREEDERLELENEGWKIRNRFYSTEKKIRILVVERPDGKVVGLPDIGKMPVDRLLNILDVSSAWGLEQEHKAIMTLGGLVRHHQMKQYLLTGCFMEKSKRTGLFYLFRKLRPTVVIDTSKDQTRIRCCLCLHSIGYYEDTFAGVMCPTDDVIAHLMLMRADEPNFWRRASQHPPWAPEAGMF